MDLLSNGIYEYKIKIMKITDKWIEDVRNYLNEPCSKHLYELSTKTTDVLELKKLLERAISLHHSYVYDAKMYLEISPKLNK